MLCVVYCSCVQYAVLPYDVTINIKLCQLLGDEVPRTPCRALVIFRMTALDGLTEKGDDD